MYATPWCSGKNANACQAYGWDVPFFWNVRSRLRGANRLALCRIQLPELSPAENRAPFDLSRIKDHTPEKHKGAIFHSPHAGRREVPRHKLDTWAFSDTGAPSIVP